MKRKRKTELTREKSGGILKRIKMMQFGEKEM